MKSKNKKQMRDSKTKADPSEKWRERVLLHGGRDRVTIRVRPELKEALIKFCEVNGLSVCHVFEALVTGYLSGMKQKIDWVSQSPTIELTVVREVKRVRRYEPASVEAKGFNYYQADPGLWVHMDGELNLNGHVEGCGCLLCRKTYKKFMKKV